MEHKFLKIFENVLIVVSFEKLLGHNFANRIKPFLFKEIKNLGLKEKTLAITIYQG